MQNDQHALATATNSESESESESAKQSKFYRLCNRIFKLIDASSIDNNAVVRRLVKQAGMDRLYPHFAFAPDGDESESPRYHNQSKTGRRNQSMVAATTTAAKNSPVLGKRVRVDQNNEGFISKKIDKLLSNTDLILQSNLALTKCNYELLLQNKKLKTSRMPKTIATSNVDCSYESTSLGGEAFANEDIFDFDDFACSSSSSSSSSSCSSSSSSSSSHSL